MEFKSLSITNTYKHTNSASDQKWCHHTLYYVFFFQFDLIAQTTKGVILSIRLW